MTFYIATQLERGVFAEEVCLELEKLGRTCTYPWWRLHGSVQGDGEARVAEVAEGERRGVLDADLVVVLLPGGRGTHAELGMAVAKRKTVLVVATTSESAVQLDAGVKGACCAFYFCNRVKRIVSFDPEEIAIFADVMLGGPKTARAP